MKFFLLLIMFLPTVSIAQTPKIDKLTLAFCEYEMQRQIIKQIPRRSGAVTSTHAAWGSNMNKFNDALFAKKTGLTKEALIKKFGTLDQQINAIEQCTEWAKKSIQ